MGEKEIPFLHVCFCLDKTERGGERERNAEGMVEMMPSSLPFGTIL